MSFIILLCFAYLLGSINSAVLVSQLLKLPDPRTQGSGNPGATNVLRAGHKGAAAVVLVSDVLKGMIPVMLAHGLSIHEFGLGVVGVAAVMGHVFPLFFRFKGGKGVATTLGVILALSTGLGLITVAIFLITIAITRYVSLASLCSIAAAPLLSALIGHSSYLIPLVVIASLVLYRHQDNIARLRDGVESKVRF